MSPLGRTYSKINNLDGGLATPADVAQMNKIKGVMEGGTKKRPIDIILEF